MTLPVAAEPEVNMKRVDSFLGWRHHLQEIPYFLISVILVAKKAPACRQRITKIKNSKPSIAGSHVN